MVAAGPVGARAAPNAKGPGLATRALVILVASEGLEPPTKGL